MTSTETVPEKKKSFYKTTIAAPRFTTEVETSERPEVREFCRGVLLVRYKVNGECVDRLVPAETTEICIRRVPG